MLCCTSDGGRRRELSGGFCDGLESSQVITAASLESCRKDGMKGEANDERLSGSK